ncbi:MULTISPECIES: transposase [unclassified Oceanispirochaeta]|uniref:IS4 family transposase n=1 Tax=unclassified Oceanispirochaeta TaxID=2635722 RepID=UPI000E08D160|nr:MULTISPECIES: transposase [unclassified Oceanispirochaeta]MBF9019049.1 transposase [Oceanispirochaeta sp. M2]NPD75550.1 transposase [Oceanispirochaeta sp. M1]RDG28592.1 IS4 family transposase [Oceanispirochaeta sp. M1]
MNNTVIENQILENSTTTRIDKFMKENSIYRNLQKSGIIKVRGIPVFRILTLIFSLVFYGKNWYQFKKVNREDTAEGKDAVYRLLNEPRFNWEKFLSLVTFSIVKKISRLTSDLREKVLIVDDSFFDRSKSKNVELLSRVHDHTDNKYKKGFSLLTLGWSDGFSFIPISFRLLSSRKEEKILVKPKDIEEKDSPGYLRRINATRSKVELLMEMVLEAKDKHLEFKYLLFDSWFAFPKTIASFVREEVNIIAMLKKMPNIRYRYNDRTVNLKELFSMIKTSWKKGMDSYSVSAELLEKKDGNLIPVKILFLKNRNKKSDWISLICTDDKLSDEEIIRIYGKRWDIEVFFKMIKSYLKLAKEFQGRTYDMLIAHTTIVFLRYIMICDSSRMSTDEKSFGDLFFEYGDEVKDITLVQALVLLFRQIKIIMENQLFLAEDYINRILDKLMESLPDSLRGFIWQN